LATVKRFRQFFFFRSTRRKKRSTSPLFRKIAQVGGRFCCFSCRFLTLFPLSRSFQGISPRLAKSSVQLTLPPLPDHGVEKTAENGQHQFLVRARPEKITGTRIVLGVLTTDRVRMKEVCEIFVVHFFSARYSRSDYIVIRGRARNPLERRLRSALLCLALRNCSAERSRP